MEYSKKSDFIKLYTVLWHLQRIFLLLCLCCLPSLSLQAQEKILKDYEEVSETIDWQEAQEGRRIVVDGNPVLGEEEALNIYHIKPSGQTVLEYATAAEANAALRFLSLNYDCYKDRVISISPTSENAILPGEEAVDPYVQMGLADKKSFMQKTGSPVIVAVLDGGFAVEHPLLKDRILEYRDDTGSEEESAEEKSHGTHVAGIVAKSTPEQVRLLLYKVMAQEKTTTFTMVNALKSSIASGADVINLSLEWTDQKTGNLVKEVVEEAYKKGVIVCTAAGNQASVLDKYTYPQSIDQAVTVGAVEFKNQQNRNTVSIASFSNRGKEIDFVAPGVDILSACAMTGGETEKSGTSMSAPMIASCFAYVKMAEAQCSSARAISLLRECCSDLGDSGKDEIYGWGMPNLTLWQAAVSEDHDYIADLTEFIPASCCHPGSITYVCREENCDSSYTKQIPMLEHSWENVSEGNQLWICCHQCGLVKGKHVLEEKYLLASGNEGDIQWRITKDIYDNYTLQILGQGRMSDLQEYPWGIYSNIINSIVIEDGVENLPKLAFMNMRKLQEVVIPPSVVEMAAGVFAGCENLREISLQGNTAFATVPGTLCSRDLHTLYYCNPNYADYPEEVREIASYAFYRNKVLTQFTVRSDMYLHAYAFLDCQALSEIYFLEETSLEEGKLEEHAFENVVADVYYEKAMPAGITDAGLRLRGRSYILSEYNSTVLCSDTKFKVDSQNWATPGVTVTWNGKILTKGIHYDLSYYNNSKPGKAYVKIQGKGSYTGSLKKEFTIEKAVLNLDQIKQDLEEADNPLDVIEKYKKWEVTIENLDDSTVTNLQCGDIVVKAVIKKTNPYYICGSTSLEGEYRIRLPHQYLLHSAVKATCFKEGKKSYYSCTKCQGYFDAEKKEEVSKDSISLEKLPHTYAHRIKQATPGGDGLEWDECTVCQFRSHEVRYFHPETVTISKKSFVYNGKCQKPVFIFKTEKGEVISRENYSISYPCSVKVGNYIAKVTWKNHYSGRQSYSYKILPKSSKITKVTAGKKAAVIQWKKITQQVAGYEIQYASNKKFTSPKSVKVNKNCKKSIKIKGLKSHRRYYFKIRSYQEIKGIKYVSTWSPTVVLYQK